MESAIPKHWNTARSNCSARQPVTTHASSKHGCHILRAWDTELFVQAERGDIRGRFYAIRKGPYQPVMMQRSADNMDPMTSTENKNKTWNWCTGWKDAQTSVRAHCAVTISCAKNKHTGNRLHSAEQIYTKPHTLIVRPLAIYNWCTHASSPYNNDRAANCSYDFNDKLGPLLPAPPSPQ